MNLDRAGGILLHLTSLPGPRGIGDLGAPAHRALDWLHQAGCRLWQFLPVSPAGRGWSPYQSASSFAGNPLLISLDRLADDGLIPVDELEALPSSNRVDFTRVQNVKRRALAAAADRWRRQGRPDREDFEAWAADNEGWLDDFALFMALREAQGGRSWSSWASDLARREPTALAQAKASLGPAIEFHRLLQFWFWGQWDALRDEAGRRGIRLIGDLPIYPDHDSADVWARPDLFKLNERGHPTFLAGVPPDYFSPTGQLWEAPVYRWERHKEDGFRWWIERVRHAASCFDAVRLDHFRGLVGFWEVTAPAVTADGGRWVEGPGGELLSAIRAALGNLPIVAEDLGVMTEAVARLRDDFELPGMRVLQFDLEDAAAGGVAPRPYVERSVAYTGTHDNDTSTGWFASADEATRRAALDLVGGDGDDIAERMIRWVGSTEAGWAIVPMQDVLRLGSEARMNVPGRREGNWGWRLTEDQLSERHAARVFEWNRGSGRLA